MFDPTATVFVSDRSESPANRSQMGTLIKVGEGFCSVFLLLFRIVMMMVSGVRARSEDASLDRLGGNDLELIIISL